MNVTYYDNIKYMYVGKKQQQRAGLGSGLFVIFIIIFCVCV